MNPMASRVLAVKPSQSGPIVFCDFDGTITQVDVTDQILTQLADPSWQEVEQEWVRGLIGSRECLERQMALVETSANELNSLIDSVPIDPYFSEFYQFTREWALPFYVVSDGFDYVVRRVLRRSEIEVPLRHGSHFFASALRLQGRRLLISFPNSSPSCEHDCATCKPAIIRRLGLQFGRRLGRRPNPIIFIGDGLSDRFAVEESDLIFAKRQFLTYCREKGIACRPFETFADIESTLEEILENRKLKETVQSRKLKVKSQGLKVEVAVEV